MTALAATPARLRAMREAVSEWGWMPITDDDLIVFGGFVHHEMLARKGRRAGPARWVTTPAGRAWLKENDGEGGK